MKSFWLAIQFMTRLPTPHYQSVEAEEVGRSINYFPFVGIVVGVALVATAQLSHWVPFEITAAIVLAMWVWITGALHLDGVADTADGWLGGVGNHQRALEIMKDSRIGTGGGVALVIVLLLKWLALVYVIEAQLWFLLLITPLIGRVASISLMPITRYVSQQGIAEDMAEHLNSYVLLFWLSIAIVGVIWLEPLMLMFIVVVWWWMRWIMIKITGGMTGDTAGAMTEAIEVAVLILATVFLLD